MEVVGSGIGLEVLGDSQLAAQALIGGLRAWRIWRVAGCTFRRRGQSLVVWAISEGREAARALDVWLMGESALEAKDESFIHIEQEA